MSWRAYGGKYSVCLSRHDASENWWLGSRAARDLAQQLIVAADEAETPNLPPTPEQRVREWIQGWDGLGFPHQGGLFACALADQDWPLALRIIEGEE